MRVRLDWDGEPVYLSLHTWYSYTETSREYLRECVWPLRAFEEYLADREIAEVVSIKKPLIVKAMERFVYFLYFIT